MNNAISMAAAVAATILICTKVGKLKQVIDKNAKEAQDIEDSVKENKARCQEEYQQWTEEKAEEQRQKDIKELEQSMRMSRKMIEFSLSNLQVLLRVQATLGNNDKMPEFKNVDLTEAINNLNKEVWIYKELCVKGDSIGTGGAVTYETLFKATMDSLEADYPRAFKLIAVSK